jgi:opacity protein-like surface antigen
MKKILSFIFVVLISPQALADETEISVFGGYRIGGEIQSFDTDQTVDFDETNSLGILIGYKYDAEYFFEFVYTSQNTDLNDTTTSISTKLLNVDIEYFLLGGSQIWKGDKIDKFFGAGIGVIHLSPANAVFSSTSKLALSVAGGAVYKFTDNIGLRFELRTYFSSLGDSAVFCNSGSNGGQCTFIGDGVLSQAEVNAGLRFRF